MVICKNQDAFGVTCQVFKPLQGLSFYIDAEDHEDENTVENLEQKITSLGGTICRLLSKATLYFVSGGLKAKKTRRSGRFLKQNETRAKKKRHWSGTSISCSSLDRARKMGLRIFSIGKALTWLKEVEIRKVYISPSKVDNCSSRNNSSNISLSSPLDNIPLGFAQKSTPDKSSDLDDIEELVAPFLKVEDSKRFYEPQYIELDDFPSISFETKVPRSPFMEPVEKGNESQDKCQSGVSCPVGTASRYSGSGWCDICYSFFRFRDKHILARKHLKNLANENFEKLYELIRGYDGSFSEFLKSAKEQGRMHDPSLKDKTENLPGPLHIVGSKQTEYCRSPMLERNITLF